MNYSNNAKFETILSLKLKIDVFILIAIIYIYTNDFFELDKNKIQKRATQYSTTENLTSLLVKDFLI